MSSLSFGQPPSTFGSLLTQLVSLGQSKRSGHVCIGF